MNKKHLALVVSAMNVMGYASQEKGVYQPYNFIRDYNFSALPVEIKHQYQINEFDKSIVMFLYGSIKETSSLKYNKRILGNLEIFCQTKSQGTKIIPSYYTVKNDHFFWERKDFNELNDFEKQLTEYYKGAPTSNIKFFYAVTKPTPNKSYFDFTSNRFSDMDEQINHIWGIEVDNMKYCTVWVKDIESNDLLLVDKDSTVIAKKTRQGKITFEH